MKKNLISTTLLCLAIVTISKAQFKVNREWQENSGSPLINPLTNITAINWTKSVTDGSGNIYTVGHSNVSGEGENIYLSKYNAGGTLVFDTTYNSSGTNNDYGTAIQLDGSGNIIKHRQNRNHK